MSEYEYKVIDEWSEEILNELGLQGFRLVLSKGNYLILIRDKPPTGAIWDYINGVYKGQQ